MLGSKSFYAKAGETEPEPLNDTELKEYLKVFRPLKAPKKEVKNV